MITFRYFPKEIQENFLIFLEKLQRSQLKKFLEKLLQQLLMKIISKQLHYQICSLNSMINSRRVLADISGEIYKDLADKSSDNLRWNTNRSSMHGKRAGIDPQRLTRVVEEL